MFSFYFFQDHDSSSAILTPFQVEENGGIHLIMSGALGDGGGAVGLQLTIIKKKVSLCNDEYSGPTVCVMKAKGDFHGHYCNIIIIGIAM